MKLLIIHNLASGPGDDSIYDLFRMLAASGTEITIRYMDASSPLSSLLEDADRFQGVVAAGGDGTVSAVLYELRNSGVPVLPFPTGTANLLAMNLDYPPTGAELAEMIKCGKTARFDLGEIETTSESGVRSVRGFSVIAGAGYDAFIMNTAKQLKPTIGQAAYFAAAASNPFPTYSSIELQLDGEVFKTKGIAALIVNFAKIQLEIPVAPANDPQDGLFEIVVAKTKFTAGLLPAFAMMAVAPDGSLLEHSDAVEIHRAKNVAIHTDPDLPIQFDGEVHSDVTPLSARVLPGAATVFVPDSTKFKTAAEDTRA